MRDRKINLLEGYKLLENEDVAPAFLFFMDLNSFRFMTGSLKCLQSSSTRLGRLWKRKNVRSLHFFGLNKFSRNNAIMLSVALVVVVAAVVVGDVVVGIVVAVVVVRCRLHFSSPFLSLLYWFLSLL